MTFLWLACVLTFVSPLVLKAQSLDDLMPGRFQQVTTLDEITADSYYLIGAEYHVRAEGRDNRGFCLMTSDMHRSGSCFLGVESDFPLPDVLLVNDLSCVWNFKVSRSGDYQLYSPQKNKGIAELRGGTSLYLNSSDWISWKLGVVEKSVFCLVKREDDTRALGLNWMPEDIRFGAYSARNNEMVRLHIYKLISNNFELPGVAVVPRDGDRVAVCSEGKVRRIMENGDVTMSDMTPYLLRNGTLAFHKTIPTLKCKWKDGESFILSDSDGQGWKVFFEESDMERQWTVKNGYVVTGPDSNRYLVWSPEMGFLLKELADLEKGGFKPVFFLPVDSIAGNVKQDGGVMQLSGSWDAESLADVNWEGVSVLDLQAISLPVAPRPFTHFPDSSNILILVSEEVQNYCPDSWRNVVVCEGDKCNLFRKWNLTDRCPLFFVGNIEVEAGQVTYVRQAYADGFWETLCVPFDAAVPDDFRVERCVGTSPEDGALLFEPVTEIKANEPLIFRYLGSPREGTVRFELESLGGKMYVEDQWGQAFRGTYDILKKEKNGILYFLNAEGDAFVRVAAGSGLSPFRAYFFGGDKALLRVSHSGMQSVIQVENLKHGQPFHFIP